MPGMRIGRLPLAVAAGSVLFSVSLVLPSTGEVEAWERGAGEVRRTTPTFQNLAAAGSDVLCAIRADESLDCWGRSRVAVRAAPGGAFTAVSAARRVACGIRPDSRLDCWGRWWSDVDHTSRVRPPSGAFTAIDLAEVQGCGIREDGGLTCFGAPERATVGRPPPAGSFVDVAAVHDEHGGCAIRLDATLACWGDDRFGQASPPAGRFRDVAAGRMTFCAIRASGRIACWGLGLYGAADPPPGRFSALSIGGDTGCAIALAGQRLRCWGADLGPAPPVPVVSVAIGDTIAAVITTDGEVHTWGETHHWPVWGFGEPRSRHGFGVFRLVDDLPDRLPLGEPFALTLATTPVEPAPSFRVVTGELPPGVVLTAQGLLHGRPSEAGAFGPITLVADNGVAPPVQRTLTLEVSSPGPRSREPDEGRGEG